MKQKDLINLYKELLEKRDVILSDTIDLLKKHIDLLNKDHERLKAECEHKEVLSKQLSIVLYNVHLITRERVKERIQMQLLQVDRLSVGDTAKLLNIKDSSLRTFLSRNKKCPQPIKEVGLSSYYLSKDIIYLIDYLIDNSNLIKNYESILSENRDP